MEDPYPLDDLIMPDSLRKRLRDWLRRTMSEPNPTYEKNSGSRFIPATRKPEGIFMPEPAAKKYDGWRILALLGRPATESEPESIWIWACPRNEGDDLNISGSG